MARAPHEHDAHEVRWLSADEEIAWMSLIGVLLQLPAALDAQLQRDSGVTFYEYSVFVALSHGPEEGRRMSDLAVVTSGQLPRLSQVITRMEKRGWVERRPDPDDGRATRVVLRPAGRRLLEEAAPGHVETVRELVFDRLSAAQVKQLRSITASIVPALGPINPLLETRIAEMRGAERR